MTICICGHDLKKHSQQGCMTIIDNDADKYCPCELTRMDVAEDEAAELRRQLSEAKIAIDAMAQIVGAADEVRRQLEQARSDIEDYRIRVNELFEACKAAHDWFKRNTKRGHTPGSVEKMLIDAISKADVVTA